MKSLGNTAWGALFGSVLLGTAACSTVPKEAVELSYTIGNDIRAVHQSYRQLIELHFAELRADLVRKFDKIVIPGYLFGAKGDPGWVKTGRLVESINGNDSEGVELWALVAAEGIDRTRRETVAPLDAQEQAFLMDIDELFARLMRANSMVTAHLNSVRRVQEVQSEMLKALKLDGLRERINKSLASASEKAAEASAIIDEWKGRVEDTAGSPESTPTDGSSGGS